MELQDLLLKSTVRIETEARCGTGFFVAPGMVVTCAHVVEDPGGGDYPFSDIGVVWGKDRYLAKVTRYAASPEPDVAVLKVTIDRHPVAYLFAPTRADDPLFLCGYPTAGSSEAACQSIEGSEPRLDTLRLEPGLSSQCLEGAPLLNLRTGGVCAILNQIGDPSLKSGGRATRVTVISGLFPEIHQSHDAHHQKESAWFDCSGQMGTVIAARSHMSATKEACEGPIQPLLTPADGSSAKELLVPLALRPRATTGVESGVYDIRSVLDRCWTARHGLLIVGPTGSGRSSILRSLGYQAASSFRDLGAVAQDSVFPLLLRANQLTHDRDSVEDQLIRAMANAVGRRPGSLPSGFLSDLADTPGLRLLVMIDGVDEIQNQRDLADLVGFIGSIQSDPGFGPRTQLVATSRPSAAEHFRYSNFDVYETEPLDRDAVRIAANKWLGESSDFLARNPRLLAGGLLSSPLILALSLKLFERSQSELPDQAVTLYGRLVDGCIEDWKTRELQEIYGPNLMERAEDLLGFLALELLRSTPVFDREWLEQTAKRFFKDVCGLSGDKASVAIRRLADFVRHDSMFLGSVGDRFYWTHLSFRDYFAASCLVKPFLPDGESVREIERRWFDANWGKAPSFALQLLPDEAEQSRIVDNILSSARSVRLNFLAGLIRDGARLRPEFIERLIEALLVQARNERDENGSEANLTDGEPSGFDLLLSLVHVDSARKALESLLRDEGWPMTARTRARARLKEALRVG